MSDIILFLLQAVVIFAAIAAILVICVFICSIVRWLWDIISGEEEDDA